MSWLVLPKSPTAKTATIKTLMTKLMKRSIAASMKKYMLASLTWLLLLVLILLDLTRALCYFPQSGHSGTSIPVMTWTWSGPDTTYSYPKLPIMIAINKQKKASNFLSPYLSSSRNVKVSATVIRTPPYKGRIILPNEVIADILFCSYCIC